MNIPVDPLRVWPDEGIFRRTRLVFFPLSGPASVQNRAFLWTKTQDTPNYDGKAPGDFHLVDGPFLRSESSHGAARGASEAGAAGRLVHSRATALGDTVKKSALKKLNVAKFGRVCAQDQETAPQRGHGSWPTHVGQNPKIAIPRGKKTSSQYAVRRSAYIQRPSEMLGRGWAHRRWDSGAVCGNESAVTRVRPAWRPRTPPRAHR